jgi:hypothetical protein
MADEPLTMRVLGDVEESEVLITEQRLILWTALMWSLGVVTGMGSLLWT